LLSGAPAFADPAPLGKAALSDGAATLSDARAISGLAAITGVTFVDGAGGSAPGGIVASAPATLVVAAAISAGTESSADETVSEPGIASIVLEVAVAISGPGTSLAGRPSAAFASPASGAMVRFDSRSMEDIPTVVVDLVGEAGSRLVILATTRAVVLSDVDDLARLLGARGVVDCTGFLGLGVRTAGRLVLVEAPDGISHNKPELISLCPDPK
jgi:hypothetical protein